MTRRLGGCVMEQEHPEAFACYTNALFCFEPAAVERWIRFLGDLIGPEARK